jgi:hypothetical protein
VLELVLHQYERIRSHVGVKQCAVPVTALAYPVNLPPTDDGMDDSARRWPNPLGRMVAGRCFDEQCCSKATLYLSV